MQRKNAPSGPCQSGAQMAPKPEDRRRFPFPIMTGSVRTSKEIPDRLSSRSLKRQRLIRVVSRRLREACTNHGLPSGLLLTRPHLNVNRKFARFRPVRGAERHARRCRASCSPLPRLKRFRDTPLDQPGFGLGQVGVHLPAELRAESPRHLLADRAERLGRRDDDQTVEG